MDRNQGSKNSFWDAHRRKGNEDASVVCEVRGLTTCFQREGHRPGKEDRRCEAVGWQVPCTCPSRESRARAASRGQGLPLRFLTSLSIKVHLFLFVLTPGIQVSPLGVVWQLKIDEPPGARPGVSYRHVHLPLHNEDLTCTC